MKINVNFNFAGKSRFQEAPTVSSVMTFSIYF